MTNHQAEALQQSADYAYHVLYTVIMKVDLTANEERDALDCLNFLHSNFTE
jgi:hypothetical protein